MSQEIINKVGPDVQQIFREMRDELGGQMTLDLGIGLVAGYLRGKGYTWKDAFIGAFQFKKTVEELKAVK